MKTFQEIKTSSTKIWSRSENSPFLLRKVRQFGEKNLSDKYGNESLMAETIFAWWNFDSTRFRPTECRFHQTPTHRESIPPNANPWNVDSTKCWPTESRFHKTPTQGKSIPPRRRVFTASSKVRITTIYIYGFFL